MKLLQEFTSAGAGRYAESCAELDAQGDGNLWCLTDEALVNHLMNEMLGLWVYAAALREKILQRTAASDELASRT